MFTNYSAKALTQNIQQKLSLEKETSKDALKANQFEVELASQAKELNQISTDSIGSELINTIENLQIEKELINIENMERQLGMNTNESIFEQLGFEASGRGNRDDWNMEGSSIKEMADSASSSNKVGSHTSTKHNGPFYGDDYVFQLDENGEYESWYVDDEGYAVPHSEEDAFLATEGQTQDSNDDAQSIIQEIYTEIDGCDSKGELMFQTAVVSVTSTAGGTVADLPGAAVGGALGYVASESICRVGDAIAYVVDKITKIEDPENGYIPVELDERIVDAVTNYDDIKMDTIIDNLGMIRIIPAEDNHAGGPYTGPSMGNYIGSSGGRSTGTWGDSGGGITEFIADMYGTLSDSMGGTSTGGDIPFM
ncbi:hypothetical protein [Prochlorococcus sp. MIT 1306]|uniref:hypothetical protein n=1 Tax=Prochlorococcus sp. MIT 1306 TaxID=1799667 RepID=UPI0007BBCDDC|nr:hypothetical protein [Prochlorococcus sp. MIT 1306]KZR63164.1 hypothetical protein PMIT1306_01647 [Prochlorococcus sp. MIT 1306]